jgi:uncharacterized protein YbbC (DUF1343 family)
LALVKWLQELHPREFDWRREEYEFVTDRLAIDLLLGHPDTRSRLVDGAPVHEVLRELESTATGFDKTRADVMLYK